MTLPTNIIEEKLVDDTESTLTYNYVDSTNNINVLARKVYKNENSFEVFPWYKDRRDNQVKSKYKKIKSILFEGFENIPSGFIKKEKKGYGFTKFLSPLKAFLEKNFDIEKVVISTKRATMHIDKDLVLSYNDLEKLRKQIAANIRISNEKNANITNNEFADFFPSLFTKNVPKYIGGTIANLFYDYRDITKNLSTEDKKALIEHSKFSIRNKVIEKIQLIQTKEAIEQRFIEDIIIEFEKLNKQVKVTEEKWQEFFKNNPWIFYQLFAYPVVLIKDKAYVGGKTIHNGEGKIVDFLYTNKLTNNAALVEIKKHTTALLRKTPYRGLDVFRISDELAGAISQVLDQKYMYTREPKISESDPQSFNPTCIVIIGTISTLSTSQKKSFELFRTSLKDVTIITYDELLDRMKLILTIFRDEPK